MTIEVASDLRDLFGRCRKEEEQAGGIRLKNFKTVAGKVEEACKRRGIPIRASLIRKASLSESLG